MLYLNIAQIYNTLFTQNDVQKTLHTLPYAKASVTFSTELDWLISHMTPSSQLNSVDSSLDPQNECTGKSCIYQNKVDKDINFHFKLGQ